MTRIFISLPEGLVGKIEAMAPDGKASDDDHEK